MESTQTSSKNNIGYPVLNNPVFDYKRLKSRRLECFFTQEEIAIQCNVSVNTISAIECGLFNPRLNLFMKLCFLLSLEPYELCHMPDPLYSTYNGGKLR